MRKQLYAIMTVTIVLSMLLVACGGGDATDTPVLPTATTAAEAPTATPEPEPTSEAGFRVGFVTDTGGIDDQSFNTTQWKGIERAVEELGVAAQFIQSDEATQYEPNLTEFASQGYDLVIASGFFLHNTMYTFLF